MAQIDVLNKSEDTSPDKTKYQKSDLEEDGGISSHGNVDRYGYLIVDEQFTFGCVLVFLECNGKGKLTRRQKNLLYCERNFILRV